MNKKELVAAVAAKTEMTQASVEKALKALVEVTVAELPRKAKYSWSASVLLKPVPVLPVPARIRRQAKISRLQPLPFPRSKQAKHLKKPSM